MAPPILSFFQGTIFSFKIYSVTSDVYNTYMYVFIANIIITIVYRILHKFISQVCNYYSSPKAMPEQHSDVFQHSWPLVIALQSVKNQNADCFPIFANINYDFCLLKNPMVIIFSLFFFFLSYQSAWTTPRQIL